MMEYVIDKKEADIMKQIEEYRIRDVTRMLKEVRKDLHPLFKIFHRRIYHPRAKRQVVNMTNEELWEEISIWFNKTLSDLNTSIDYMDDLEREIKWRK